MVVKVIFSKGTSCADCKQCQSRRRKSNSIHWSPSKLLGLHKYILESRPICFGVLMSNPSSVIRTSNRSLYRSPVWKIQDFRSSLFLNEQEYASFHEASLSISSGER